MKTSQSSRSGCLPTCQLLFLIDGFSNSIEDEFPLQPGDLGDILAFGESLLLQQQKRNKVMDLIPEHVLYRPPWTASESSLIKPILSSSYVRCDLPMTKYQEQRRVAKQNIEQEQKGLMKAAFHVSINELMTQRWAKKMGFK
ncbi:hypothetical protein VitviT2T_024061 [Vitis vinifera]|uniref:Uncharacterized protein n=1 Tax=Vitis vinifera TaxID=29760 RepID=A0ABY9DGG1_VITVI|nr:hypothetical protein VitviT2T_024061 [Vitis vinifera]